MKRETSLVDNHYVVPMLWKKPKLSMPESKHVAAKRLEHLTRRFKCNPELYRIYSQGIQTYISKGYARKLSKSEASCHSPSSWYLPHHPVTNINKPGKVRIVFDAAAKVKGISLNDRLDTGPDLTNNLAGILIQFRRYHVAIVADIETMFHKVHVAKDDAESLRFLWKESLNEPASTYQMLVHIFGAKTIRIP